MALGILDASGKIEVFDTSRARVGFTGVLVDENGAVSQGTSGSVLPKKEKTITEHQISQISKLASEISRVSLLLGMIWPKTTTDKQVQNALERVLHVTAEDMETLVAELQK